MIKTRTIIEVPIAQLLDRNIPAQDAMWDELINHHMFKGNDTWLPLDWYEDTKLEQWVMWKVRESGIYAEDNQIMLEVMW